MKAKIVELSLEQIFRVVTDKYFVPLYQREYAWGRTEIERMLNDLYLAFSKGEGRNYYLGSFVVRRKEQNLFELIDGQQRMITLSMLFALYLNEGLVGKVLNFELRAEADGYIDSCYGGEARRWGSEMLKGNAFAEAIGVIRGFFPESQDRESPDGGANRDAIEDVLATEKDGISFKEYLLNKVILFRVELPGSTDVNSYFEIMNNRGEQLKYHEIMKANLLAKLDEKCRLEPGLNGREGELAEMFDDIWTACSRMNGYLGQHLHACAEYDSRPPDDWTDRRKWDAFQRGLSSEYSDGTGGVEQSVFTEFANFLMHVLKCYQQQYIPGSEVEVTLDERDMQVKYEALEKDIDPIRFLDLLIRLRLRFDKYVVKAVNDENGDVGAWQLCYVKKNKRNYDTVNTFDGDLQSKLVCFESMLQVSFNTQRNKVWLQHLLELDEDRLDGSGLLEALQGWAKERLNAYRLEKEKAGKDFYCLGLESSRFMLNMVDYLMWKQRTDGSDETDFAVPEEFVFKYLNSVEHHHPQHDDQLPHGQRWNEKQINDIGNLFLVYSSENASMNNREPQSKKHRYLENNGGVSPRNPKRNWMYEHTYDDGRGWPLAEMEKLSQYVRNLLEAFLSPVEM